MAKRSAANIQYDYYRSVELQDLVDHIEQTTRKKAHPDHDDNDSKWSPLIKRINKILLVYLTSFCRLDFFRFYQSYCPQAIDGQELKTHVARGTSYLSWPTVALFSYIYMASKMCLNMYFQYIKDCNAYQMNFWLKFMDNTSVSRAAKQQVAMERISWANSHLQWLGAPFTEIGFIAQVGYQYVLSMSLIHYVVGSLWYRWVFPLDFRLGRLVLYPKSEQTYSLQLVCDQVNKFINSSKNFANNFCNCARFVTEDDDDGQSEESHVKLNPWLTSRRRDPDYQIVYLRQLAFTDKLRPLNWSPRWHRQINSYFCFFVVSFVVWSIPIFVVIMFLIGFLFDQIHKDDWDLLDWLMAVENFLCVLYFLVPAILYFSIIPLSCMDQTFYINRLLSLTRQCSRHIQSIMTTPEQNSSQLSIELELRTTNGQILHCFVHYKIFIGQFETIRRVFEFAASYVIIIWFCMPITSLLHAGYVNDQNAKSLSFGLCLVTCLVLNVMLIYICHVYNNSINLYKSLYSLLAQVVETSHQLDSPDSEPIHDAHLISLLRKLLKHPDLFMEQFSILPLGIRLRYENLIQLYFWSGIILIMMLLGVGSGRDDNSVFGRLLSDPFGLKGQD